MRGYASYAMSAKKLRQLENFFALPRRLRDRTDSRNNQIQTYVGRWNGIIRSAVLVSGRYAGPEDLRIRRESECEENE